MTTIKTISNLNDIRLALAKVTTLDSWDIQATLGGVNYIVRQAAINAIVRQMPDPPPEGSGIEYFQQYEQAMKAPQMKEAAAPIVGIAEAVTEVLNEYTDLPPTQYEDVLKFMSERPPRREVFVADYDNRKRLGMRPGVPLSAFVDMEMATAMTRHQQLIARGEQAVQFLEGVNGTSESAPEWLYEAIHNKLLQKLEQRWMRAELRRTNPRITKEQRDLAEANQALIVKVIEELGGEKPSFKEEMTNDDELDKFIEKASSKALPPA